MANELVVVYPAGNTLYAHLFDSTGRVWNGSSFEAPASGNWGDYDIAMSEAATSTQIYRGDMPAVDPGIYSFVVRLQAGGSPAVTDIAVATGQVQWDGTAVMALYDAATGLGAGASEFIYTVTSALDSSPVPGADVWVASDADGDNILASGTTDSNGQVTFYLDPGTVYFWTQKAGHNFENPDQETVT